MKLYDSSSLISQGVAPMSEPVTVTYMDLDRLIDKCGLTEKEKYIVDLLMLGYTRSDIRDDANMAMDVIVALLNSAIDKIVDMNEYEWHKCQTRRRNAVFV